jgi:class III cytochrome C family protein
MKRRTAIVYLVSVFFLVPGVTIAQQDFPDVIEFDGAADGGGSGDIYPSTYTGPVTFSHKKHNYEYGFKCTDCHHDSDAATLMKSGASEELRCGHCHKKEGYIRGAIAENALSNEDLLAHRANALHQLCRGCHKEHNATVHVVMAPEACRICHAKRPQDWVIK